MRIRRRIVIGGAAACLAATASLPWVTTLATAAPPHTAHALAHPQAHPQQVHVAPRAAQHGNVGDAADATALLAAAASLTAAGRLTVLGIRRRHRAALH